VSFDHGIRLGGSVARVQVPQYATRRRDGPAAAGALGLVGSVVGAVVGVLVGAVVESALVGLVGLVGLGEGSAFELGEAPHASSVQDESATTARSFR
jgi:hypothetical protein